MLEVRSLTKKEHAFSANFTVENHTIKCFDDNETNTIGRLKITLLLNA